MINASRHNSTKIPTAKAVTCPECKKNRLYKYINEDGSIDSVSNETVEVRDETRHLEVCEFCTKKYQKSDNAFIIQNMKKLRKAFKNEEVEEGESDHKDFSLN